MQDKIQLSQLEIEVKRELNKFENEIASIEKVC